jgi:N-formylglutamate deformylase
MYQSFFNLSGGVGPLVVTAIHEGHLIRPVLNAYINLSAKQRLREEDPHTGTLAAMFPDHIIANYSRFEVDLNRDRNKAIYLKPEDAWGLHVWRESLPQEEVQESLRHYDKFYSVVRDYLQEIIDHHGFVIVYDLHTYNHRRGGPQSRPADPEQNPEINIGLGNMDLEKWRPVLDTFTRTYKEAWTGHNEVDIRENVKFDGGHFMRWIHEQFGNKACAIAIEFKKTFMDEWTNELDENHLNRIGLALKATQGPVLEKAKTVDERIRIHDRANQ